MARMYFTASLLTLIFVIKVACADELVNYVKEAHKSTVSTVQQLTCNIEWIEKGEKGSKHEVKPLIKTGTYWRDGNSARAIEKKPDGTSRDIFTDGSMLKILELRGGLAAGGLHSVNDQELTRCDAYARALFKLPLPNTSISCSLDQLLNDSKMVEKAERIIINGNEHIVLRFRADKSYVSKLKWNVCIYLDSSVNYLVRRVTYESIPEAAFPGTTKLDHQIVDFSEVSPSIFFPSAAHYDCYYDGKLQFTHDTKFTDIVINKQLPASALSFRFPRGIEISDNIRSTRYRVDEFGIRISQEVPVSQKVIFASFESVQQGEQTKNESSSWASWLPYLFLLVLITALLRLAYLKRKLNSDTT